MLIGGPGRYGVNASSSPNGDVVAAADSTASDQPPAGPGSDGPKASWIEVAATVVLALAAVATAESPAARPACVAVRRGS